MEDIISQAKGEFSRAQARIIRDITATPDDKLNWSPSATARTPVQIVAHAALGTQGIGGLLAGKPFPFANMAELDKASREMEKTYTSREAVIELAESTGAAFLAWLDSVTPEQLGSMCQFPGMAIPLVAAMTFPADHLRGHAAQIEYMQTIWGDMEFRM
ncbi:MAG TPA: DinB family protein [Capsulimonadaceae bacterium]|jgi:hypothetical protein